MQKKITARHFDLTPELRQKADAEIEGLRRYFDNIISAELTLDRERHRRMAELKVKVYKDVLTGTAETDDMINAIAQAADKVKGQLQKYKGKLKEKDAEKIAGVTASATRPETADDEIDI